MTRQKLSITIITLNEEDNIHRCLESIQWADEVIIVDSGSTDRTLDIAKSYGARIIHQDWLGFGLQKQFAVEQASYDWILALDTDEWLSDALIQEIQQELLAPKAFVYKIPRCNIFMGKPLKHGMGYPDYITRLFHKNYAKWTKDKVHEKIIASHKIAKVKNKIFHFSESSINDYIIKQLRYTTQQAEDCSQKSRTILIFRAALSPWLKFIKYYFFKLGFLDGASGFSHITCASFFCFLKYYKMLNKNNDQNISAYH